MAGCIGDKCSNCPLLPILAAIAFNTGFEEICPRLFSPSPLSLSRSNWIQVLSIVFFWMREDDCFFQWVSAHRQSDRRQVSQPLVRWWSAGRRSTSRALLLRTIKSDILFNNLKILSHFRYALEKKLRDYLGIFPTIGGWEGGVGGGGGGLQTLSKMSCSN